MKTFFYIIRQRSEKRTHAVQFKGVIIADDANEAGMYVRIQNKGIDWSSPANVSFSLQEISPRCIFTI
jgi:hypothetical protein